MVGAGGNLNLSAVTAISINLESTSDLGLVTAHGPYLLISATGGGVIVPPAGAVVPMFNSTDTSNAAVK